MLDLPLPSTFASLLRLFTYIDSNMVIYKHRHGEWSLSFKELTRMIAGSVGKALRESHFRQILSVVPNFFLHKWQVRKGVLELMVEVPENIADVVLGYECEP